MPGSDNLPSPQTKPIRQEGQPCGGTASKISSPGNTAAQGGESAVRWRALFKGDESQVREVRRWLVGLLLLVLLIVAVVTSQSTT